MTTNQLVIVAVALVVILALLLVLWVFLSRNRMKQDPPYAPESLEALDDVRIDQGERVASPVSEEIESLVQNQIRTHPDLAGHQVDFATGPDESLVIWLDGVAYHGVDDIPDERIRQAIKTAVAEFNKGG